MSSNKKVRKVKRRNNKVNLSSGKAKMTGKPTKQAVKLGAKKLARTKTRQYVLFALASFIIMQIISYITTDSPLADIIHRGALYS